MEDLMDVVVKSRHCSVPDQFRSYVDEKITRLEKLDDRVIRVEVEVSTERNKRQHDQACRVEITLRTKGPVVRAEAAAEDKQPAFDMALDRLMAQLRRAADRKRVHHGQRAPQSIKEGAVGARPEVSAPAASVPGVRRESISRSEARRVALAAQGLTAPRPSRPVGMRDLQATVTRLGQFQIDSVNVLVRAHYMPLFSRLGPYDTALLDSAAYERRRRILFEYWAHEASLVRLD